jgi:hypothetical protein
LKALAKDADERYATAKELCNDLKVCAPQGLVADRARAAEYMRRLFAGDPAIDVARGEVIHGGSEERFRPRRFRRPVQEDRAG